MAATIEQLDHTKAQGVRYAVPLWVRDEQIRVNIGLVPGRIQPHYAVRSEPIAVVGFGPSLADTWEEVKLFSHIITCSGAHKFLIERGVIPTWHLDVDPRKHKITLLGTPHLDVEYLIASACHPDLVRYLQSHQATIKLWHVFDSQEEGFRILPHGEWSLTGGCSAGLRALTMARFLGFTDLHIFGLDGSEGKTGKHADAHPNQAKVVQETVYDGVTYRTTAAFLEAARGTFHELDQMTDVKATFYGDGLVQHMAKHYVPKHVKGRPEIAIIKEPLISPEYAELNRRLHQENVAYGVSGGKYADEILKIANRLKTHSILDYGCGKGFLGVELAKKGYPIWEYDPAIPEKKASPRPADIVACTDVLEHIEPERLAHVLDDLKRCVKQIGYFVIHTGPAQKTLADGRNAHLIQQPKDWWVKQLNKFFQVGRVDAFGPLLRIVVGKKGKAHAKTSAKASHAVAPKPMGLSFGALQFRREPYVIGATQNVLADAHYQELAASFPMDLALYKAFTGGDKKYSLSERNNPEGYHEFVQSHTPWKALYDYLKAPAFAEKMLRVLAAHKVAVSATAEQLRTRFEFSLLPADGGLLRPHTDLPSKVITLVIAMPTPNQPWDAAWGGGTDVLAQMDPAQHYADYGAPEGALVKAHTYDYRANQCVVFVKSDKSWHSVGPLTGPEGQWRRSLTVNLERVS